MKILLSHSYFLRLDPKQWNIGLPYAPLGTLYAAATLRNAGYEVGVFDTMFCREAGEVNRELEEFKPDIFVLYDDGFNYLTKMCLTNMREAAFEMIKLAKEKGCTVIVSSSDATDHYEDYLNKGADFIVIGEGEQTVSDLAFQFANRTKEFQHIPGIIYRANEELIKTPNRNVIRDLDSIPFPAWDLIDINPYRDCWLKNAGFFSINVVTTRGCPYKCNWCAKPIYGNRYNARSAKNVVLELKMLSDLFAFDHVWFCDDIFGLKPGWVQEFAMLVKESNLKLKFKIQSRADLLAEEKYVEALQIAGCDNVWMGAESGSQKVLDAMDKGITIEQVARATTLLKKHRIKPSFFIQFGYPGETHEDISKTIKMINSLLPYEIGISVSYPLPGTKFYENVKSELKLKSNWTDSDEMALMFRNKYSPAFYKQLHRYVHKNYRKHIATNNLKHFVRKPLSCTIHEIRKAVSSLYYIPVSFIEKIKLLQLQNK